jgi:hypothetical protein
MEKKRREETEIKAKTIAAKTGMSIPINPKVDVIKPNRKAAVLYRPPVEKSRLE